MEDEELNKDLIFLKPFAEQIRNVGGYDSVLIITTKSDDKDSSRVSACSGSLYAANWSAEEYLIRQRKFCEPKDE